MVPLTFGAALLVAGLFRAIVHPHRRGVFAALVGLVLAATAMAMAAAVMS
jgi:hypothetical protein